MDAPEVNPVNKVLTTRRRGAEDFELLGVSAPPVKLVVGVRRSYAVAAYMAYALQHIDKRVQLIDGIGGMVREQVRSVGRNDVIIAISFTPYGKETLACVRHAQNHGAKAVVMTDSRLAPLAQGASALLLVHEGSAFAFRSLTNALCLRPGVVRRACVPARTRGRGNDQSRRLR